MTARRRAVPTREQLLVLADRAERGPLRPAEASRLRAGINQLVPGTSLQEGLATRIRRAIGRLHRPLLRGGIQICTECSGWDGNRCRGLITPWPCPTAEAARLDEQ